MAKWYSNRLDDGTGTVLSYVNDKGQVASCGTVAPQISDEQILDWFIFNLQGANVGDLIFIDGQVNQIFGRRSE